MDMPLDLAPRAPALAPARPRLVAIVVACALFMSNLDGTVIATALPAMAHSFQVDPVHMNVALTAYLVAMAAFIPASGWLADRFGTRHVFRVAIALFTLGSIACGLSASLPALVAARVLQGAGGAMMLPVGRLVLLRSVPKEELIGAMAWVTMPALIGPVIGPPVGGFIVTYFSWNWIFYINVPIGGLAILLASLYFRDMREPDPGPFDATGLLLVALCLATFMGVLETAGRHLVSPAAVAGMAATCLATGTLYAWHARQRARALLDFSLLRLPTFMVSVAAGSLFRIGIGALPFLLPLLIQLGFGRSAAQSGMITFAGALGAIGVKPITTRVLRRFGFRNTLAINGVASAVVIAIYAAFRPAWPMAVLYFVLVLGGVLRSVQFTAYNAVAYADVPGPRMSAATTLYSMLQQVSLTLGIPISAAVLQMARIAAGHTTPTPADFTLAFLALAGVSALAGPVALLLPRGAGGEMSGNVARQPR